MSVSSEIVARISANAPIFQGRVSVARNINNPTPTALPEAWVHRWTKIAGPNSTTNFTVQAISAEVSVLIATAIEKDDGVDHADIAEKQVLATLIDRTFEVGPSNEPLEMARVEIVDVLDSHQTIRVTFRFTEYVRG